MTLQFFDWIKNVNLPSKKHQIFKRNLEFFFQNSAILLDFNFFSQPCVIVQAIPSSLTDFFYFLISHTLKAAITAAVGELFFLETRETAHKSLKIEYFHAKKLLYVHNLCTNISSKFQNIRCNTFLSINSRKSPFFWAVTLVVPLKAVTPCDILKKIDFLFLHKLIPKHV